MGSFFVHSIEELYNSGWGRLLDRSPLIVKRSTNGHPTCEDSDIAEHIDAIPSTTIRYSINVVTMAENQEGNHFVVEVLKILGQLDCGKMVVT